MNHAIPVDQADHTGHTAHAEHAACCHSPKAKEKTPATAVHAHHHGHHAAAGGSLWRLSSSATLHCLTGCAIGEFIGLAIGVSLGWTPWATIVLATTLAFISGYTLGLLPLVRQGMSWRGAFKAIWLGETVSIAFMEFAMNLTDYLAGGMTAPSVWSAPFWVGYGLALPAGFLFAWPVNYWLLKRNLKKPCH